MLDKARGLKSDQLFMDLEDAVAPLAKADARKNIVQALNEGGYEDKIRAVRVNDWTTQWTYTDVIEIVEGAGANLDCIMLPKVQTADQIVALDLLLTLNDALFPEQLSLHQKKPPIISDPKQIL
jgi:citrate lyase subunit beta/citryl-CoA lyase